MWLAQTYLRGPREDFPVYAYVLSDAYANWESTEAKRLKAALAVYGRSSGPGTAIFLPNDEIDRQRINSELNKAYFELFHRLVPKFRRFGLLFTNMRFEDMNGDGANARWVFLPLTEKMEIASGIALEDFLTALEGAGAGTDPIQSVVLLIQKLSKKLPGALDALSVSLTGPSVNIGKLFDAFRKSAALETNIYDGGRR